MKVKDLIKELQQYDLESPVLFNEPYRNELHELVVMGYNPDELDYQENKTENTIVEIEIDERYRDNDGGVE